MRREAAEGGGPGPNAESVVVPIKYTSATELGPVIEASLRGIGRASVIADPHTNSLIITADREALTPRIMRLIQELDQAPRENETAERVCRPVRMKAAAAREVAGMLSQMSRNELPLRIVDDRRANTVWLYGPQTLVTEYSEIALKIDENASQFGSSTPRSGESHTLKVYRLEHAEAQRAAMLVDQAAKALECEIVVFADNPAGVLFAVSDEAGHAHVREILEAVDVAPREESGPRRGGGEPRGPGRGAGRGNQPGQPPAGQPDAKPNRGDE